MWKGVRAGAWLDALSSGFRHNLNWARGYADIVPVLGRSRQRLRSLWSSVGHSEFGTSLGYRRLCLTTTSATTTSTNTKQKQKPWMVIVDLYIFFLIFFSVIFLESGLWWESHPGSLHTRQTFFHWAKCPGSWSPEKWLCSQQPSVRAGSPPEKARSWLIGERSGIAHFWNKTAGSAVGFVLRAFVVLSDGFDHCGHVACPYVTLQAHCHLVLGEHVEMKLFWKALWLCVHSVKCLVCFPEVWRPPR